MEDHHSRTFDTSSVPAADQDGTTPAGDQQASPSVMLTQLLKTYDGRMLEWKRLLPILRTGRRAASKTFDAFSEFKSSADLDVCVVDLDQGASLDQYTQYLMLENDYNKHLFRHNSVTRETAYIMDQLIALEKEIRKHYGAELENLPSKSRDDFEYSCEQTRLARIRFGKFFGQFVVEVSQ